MDYRFEHSIQLSLGEEIVVKRGLRSSPRIRFVEQAEHTYDNLYQGNFITIYDKSDDEYFTVNISDVDLAIEDKDLLEKIIQNKKDIYENYKKYWQTRELLIINKLTESFSEIKKIFNIIYPETSDIQVDINTQVLTAYVYFPQINITNSKNEKHTITDFYVKIEFNADKKLISFKGARSSVTYSEYSASYVHSHNFSRKNFHEFSSFCFGETDMAILDRALRNQFSELNLKKLLLQLPLYLEWESLEGGPYIKMSSIKKTDDFTGQTAYCPTEVIINDYFIKLLEKDDNSYLPFSLISNGFSSEYKISEDDLSNRLFEIVSEKDKCIKSSVGFLYKNNQSSTNSVNNTIHSINRSISSKPIFQFKGNDVYAKVMPNNSNNNAQFNYVHPTILNKIKVKLQKDFKEFEYL